MRSCTATYGHRLDRSSAGGPNSRSGAQHLLAFVDGRPRSRRRTPTTGWPRTGSGTNVGRRRGDERQRRCPPRRAPSCMKSRQNRTTLAGHRGRPHQHAAEHERPDRVQLEVNGGDDAEVAAAAAEPPEQVGVLGGRRLHDRAVGGDHLGLDEVVAGEAELALEPAAAAAEREPGDAGVGHAPAGDREPVLLRGGVELAPVEAGLGAHRARRRRRPRCAFMPRMSIISAVVDHRRAGDAVAAAVDRERQGLRRGRSSPRPRRRRCSRTPRSAPGRRSIMPLKTARASS